MILQARRIAKVVDGFGMPFEALPSFKLIEQVRRGRVATSVR
jgi:hypothetical protein